MLSILQTSIFNTSLLILALTAISCDSKSSPPTVTSPQAHQIEFKLIKFKNDAEAGRQAQFVITNTSNSDLRALKMQLLYEDAQGNVLGEFPWFIQADPYYLRSGESSVELMGFEIPSEATNVSIIIQSIE